MVVAILVAGLVAGVAAAVVLGGNGQRAGGLASAPGVGAANDTVAKTELASATLVVEAAAGAAPGGYAALSPQALNASSGGLTFTSGPSSGPPQVSIATAPSAGRVAGPAPANGIGGSPEAISGTAVLALHSKSGTCFYVWLGTGGPLYGAQGAQHACQASPLATPPTPAPATATAIGWDRGAYPPT